jgi:hypothetical protein
MGIALASALLALLCLCTARRMGSSPAGRVKLYWAGMCFLVLGYGSAYLRLLEWRSPEELAQYVPAYPNATIRMRAPVAIDHARAWIFETADSPRRVANFYSHIAHTNGWPIKRELAERTEVFVMRQSETVTTVVAAPRDGKTEITFFVRAAAPVSD